MWLWLWGKMGWRAWFGGIGAGIDLRGKAKMDAAGFETIQYI